MQYDKWKAGGESKRCKEYHVAAGIGGVNGDVVWLQALEGER